MSTIWLSLKIGQYSKVESEAEKLHSFKNVLFAISAIFLLLDWVNNYSYNRCTCKRCNYYFLSPGLIVGNSMEFLTRTVKLEMSIFAPELLHKQKKIEHTVSLDPLQIGLKQQ